MIGEVVNREFMRDRILDLALVVEGQLNKFPDEIPEDLRDKARGIEKADLELAYRTLRELDDIGVLNEITDEEDLIFLPRHRELASIQSALEDFFYNVDGVATDQPATDPITHIALKSEWRPTRGHPSDIDSRLYLLRRTEKSDWHRWGLTVSVAKAIKAAKRGKAEFCDKPNSVQIAPKTRLILVGDWANGVERARRVARKIKSKIDAGTQEQRQCHVVHLGDVYYAGLPHEYTRNLGNHWPVSKDEHISIGSWCLNANHDMYTGGHGYYKFLRSDIRFSQHNGCSFFKLQNKDWLIFGLDTAYESDGLWGDVGGLAEGQAEWFEQEINNAKAKKIILLSHHPPFRNWNNNVPELIDAFEPLLDQRHQVTAWFWGHDHYCAVYNAFNNITYPALVGHGGIPEKARSAYPGNIRYFDNRALADTTSIWSKWQKYAYRGFAVLDLDGPNANVEYIDETGATHRCDTISPRP